MNENEVNLQVRYNKTELPRFLDLADLVELRKLRKARQGIDVVKLRRTSRRGRAEGTEERDP